MAGPGEALTCEVIWTVSARALERLVAAGEALRHLRLEVTGEQRARVTVTEKTSRIDFDGETVFGAAGSLIDDGSTVTCLGHQGRELLSIPRDHVRAAGFASRVEPVEAPRLDGCAVVVELEEATGARFRHRLELDRATPCPPLAARLLELLLGDGQLHAGSGYPLAEVTRIVERAGAPVGARVEALAPDGAAAGDLGGFRIEDLRPSAAPDQPLHGAEGYLDLRKDAQARDERAAPSRALPVEARPWTTSIGAVGVTGVGGGTRTPLAAPHPSRNGGREPDDPEEPEPEPSSETPSGPPPTTTDAAFGLLIRQRLLTEIARDLNGALGMVAGAEFSFMGGTTESGPAGQGFLDIDWLAKAHDRVLAARDAAGMPFPPGLSTFLFCLAHDVEPPALDRGYAGPVADIQPWGKVRGRGLLDRTALAEAKTRVNSGTLGPLMLALLPPPVATKVASPGADWSALSGEERLVVMWLVLLQRVGVFRLPLPAELPFNAQDLIEGELKGYSGTLTLPPAPAATPGVCPLITSFRCRPAGLDLGLMLGKFELTGTLNRRPGSTYLLVLGVSVVAALVIPALAWVVPLLAGIAFFLLFDTGKVTLTLSGISADCRLRFATVVPGPDPAKPELTVGVTASASAKLESGVPTGFHQVLDMVIAAIAQSGQRVLDIASEEAGKALTGLIETTFGTGFPAALFRLGVPITRSTVNGKNDAHLYLESRISAPPGVSIPAIPVPADALPPALADAGKVPAAHRHYLSLVTSQNTVNILLAAAWRRQEWDAYALPATSVLGMLASPPFPVGAPVIRADVEAVTPPQVALLAGVPAPGMQHGTLTGEFKLRMYPDPNRHFDWRFTLTAPAQVVVGSTFASAAPNVELLSALYEPIDVLVDTANTTVAVTRLSSVELAQNKVMHEWVDEWGKFDKVTTAEFAEVEKQHMLTKGAAASYAPLVLAAARFALRWRNVTHSPRRDGVYENGQAAGPADPLTLLTYQFDGSDPDGAEPDSAASQDVYAVADVGFGDGLLFHHLSLAGTYASALDPENVSLQTREVAGTVLDARGPPNLDPKIQSH